MQERRSVAIRLMRRDDLDVVIDLASKAFGEEYRPDATSDFSHSFSGTKYSPATLVAVDGGSIVGIVQVVWGYLMPDTYIISWLCVWPERQRNGIGSALMDEVLRYISDDLLGGRRGTVYLSAAVGRNYYGRWGFVSGPSNHHDAAIMLKVVN